MTEKMESGGREQSGEQSGMCSATEHECGLAGEVEHGEDADGGEAGDGEHADEHAGRRLANQDVQGTWEEGRRGGVGGVWAEQQPAWASPLA